ncbi:MAG: hypothetical protein K1X63_15715 [Chitinophagales bacterium]|nr:hypothetical protein [Chitinophagales bacterium]
MKKSFFVTMALTAMLFAFKQESQKDLARVNRVQGFYIFSQCQPLADYAVLGTVKKTGVVMTGSPTEMFNILIKKVQKEYPNANGIIFDDVAMEHATCIELK